METKFCKDCKHCKIDGCHFLKIYLCTLNHKRIVKVNLVTGENYFEDVGLICARDNREHSGKCKPSAKYFEKIETLFEKIKSF